MFIGSRAGEGSGNRHYPASWIALSLTSLNQTAVYLEDCHRNPSSQTLLKQNLTVQVEFCSVVREDVCWHKRSAKDR